MPLSALKCELPDGGAHTGVSVRPDFCPSEPLSPPPQGHVSLRLLSELPKHFLSEITLLRK